MVQLKIFNLGIESISFLILMGNAENDTYLFAAGDGKDTINNYRIDVTSIDIIQFIDASFENLWFSRSSNNLQINLAGTDDRLTITNWYSSYIYQLNQVHAGTSALSSNKMALSSLYVEKYTRISKLVGLQNVEQYLITLLMSLRI